MFKSFITGAVALGLAFGATPNAAKANDAIIGGVLIGAILGGAVAAIAESSHRSDTYQPRPSRGYYAPRPSRGYHGHGYRRPVVVERRVYRSPPPRVVYRERYRSGYHGRPARGHGYHYR